MSASAWSNEALNIFGTFRRGRRLHFYAVLRETGFSKATVHTVLRRLVAMRLLEYEVERIDPVLGAVRTTPRTLYWITDEGMRRKRELRALLA